MYSFYTREDSPNIYVSIGSGKNRVQKSCETTSKKLAEKRAILWEEELYLSQHKNVLKRAKLGEIYLRYASTVERMKKPSYNVRLKTVFKPFILKYGHLFFDDFETDFMDDYTNERLDKGVANKTAHDDIVYIKAFFNYAIARKYLNENPCDGAFRPDKSIKKWERIPIPWDVVKALLMDCKLNGHESDYRYWSLIAFTGLRAGDAGNLSENDIIEDVITLYPQKTESSICQIPLHPNLIGMDIFNLRPELKQRNRSRERLQRRLKWMNYDPHADLHSLRHSLATELANRQVNPDTIQLILGHTNKEMTKNYIHPGIELAREIINKL